MSGYGLDIRSCGSVAAIYTRAAGRARTSLLSLIVRRFLMVSNS